MVHRVLVLAYGLAAYSLTLATLIYSVGFIGGFVTPTQLDGPRQGSVGVALAVDLGLLAIFAIQHSGMARPAFKRWLTRFIPVASERSTYVLLSCVALLVVFRYWRPIGGRIWTTDDPLGRGLLYTIFGMGWVIVLTATVLINHFDLFGVRQVWLYSRGRSYSGLEFMTPWLYRVVRHPLYVGWLLVFWATPVMTAAHLVFAAALTLYILVAIRWEERDLAEAHPEYASYRRRVPMLIPRWSRTSAGDHDGVNVNPLMSPGLAASREA